MANKVKNPSLYRSLAHLRKGGLHRAFKIPEGTKIPKERIEAGTHSSNEHIRQMSQMAQNMSHFKH